MINPDDTIICSMADGIRHDLVLIEDAAKTGERENVGRCLSVAADLVRRAERILTIVRKYHRPGSLE